jgi:hypothetical protein
MPTHFIFLFAPVVVDFLKAHIHGIKVHEAETQFVGRGGEVPYPSIP